MPPGVHGLVRVIRYVTERGKLVGVVGPNEVREGIERVGIRALERRVQPHPVQRIRFHPATDSDDDDDDGHLDFSTIDQNP